ncbi:cyclic di-GMP phosphodiesterase [Xenorhabdus thuongxuanensis]|uniref:Cyclic di-GMP phosphodiesterase n=2 Tax=Xenorhabdus thuongxuanensis TaxID=1873484 RepID=A0A1Q5U8E3_9GAMM|nr:cyclic di-GMP phosphodiesterase [Xenorhabdus thuongxuanensis]
MELNLKSYRSLYRMFVMLFITITASTGFIFWRLFSNYRDNIQPGVELVCVFILLPLLTLISAVFFYKHTKTITIPEYRLKKAIKNKQFIPYIQPIICSKNNEIVGCEILVRWQHPIHGLLTPNKFIAQIEKSDLIIPLTHNLITQVRDYFSPIAHQLPANFHFNFNISARHYKDVRLVDDCHHFLKSFPTDSIKLILEITERELLELDNYTINLFNKLDELGVLIALDDFGTGFSNYNYLQKINVNLVKIGHNFVSKMNTDMISKNIVENIIDLALRLHLEIVAEGIENQRLANQLKNYSVDYLQGYYFDRPMPLEEFVKKWL